MELVKLTLFVDLDREMGHRENNRKENEHRLKSHFGFWHYLKSDLEEEK